MLIPMPRMAPSIALISLLLVSLPSRALAQGAGPVATQSTSDTLVNWTKALVKSAAKLGVEEAGTRLLGSGWKYAKAVLEPTYSELARKYPALKFLDTPAAETAATRATADLDANPEWRKQLMDRFTRLEHEQAETLLQLSVLEKRMDEVEQLAHGLPKREDPFAELKKQPQSDGRDTVLILGSIYLFAIDAASTPDRAGNYRRTLPGSFVAGRHHWAPTEYRAFVSGIFDEDGARCRDLMMSYNAAGRWQPEPSVSKTLCRIRGNWYVQDETSVLVRRRVRAIVAETIGIDIRRVLVDAVYETDLDVDLLEMILLQLDFEKAFNVDIPDADVDRWTTVGSTILYLIDRVRGTR